MKHELVNVKPAFGEDGHQGRLHREEEADICVAKDTMRVNGPRFQTRWHLDVMGTVATCSLLPVSETLQLGT